MLYHCWIVGCRLVESTTQIPLPSSRVSVDEKGEPLEIAVDDTSVACRGRVAPEFLLPLDDRHGLLIVNFDFDDQGSGPARRLRGKKRLSDVRWSQSHIGRLYRGRLHQQQEQSARSRQKELGQAELILSEIVHHD